MRHPKPADFKPNELFPAGHPKAGQLQCQAWNRNEGRQCESNPIKGKTKCRVHGGKTPSGPASPHFKTGRYSSYIPARLASRYEEAQKDSELLSLREEISLTDARIADLLQRVDSGEAGANWRKVQQALKDYRLAVLQQNGQGMADAITLIEMAAVKGVNDYVTWDEVNQLLEQRRRLVETERKRLVDMHQMISTERLMLLVTAIAGVIQEHVSDRTKLDAIQTGIQRLISVGD